MKFHQRYFVKLLIRLRILDGILFTVGVNVGAFWEGGEFSLAYKGAEGLVGVCGRWRVGVEGRFTSFAEFGLVCGLNVHVRCISSSSFLCFSWSHSRSFDL